jgi:cell division protein YceG involved in septum cleavage
MKKKRTIKPTEKKRVKRKYIKFLRRITVVSFALVGLFSMVSFAKGINTIDKKIEKFEKVEVEIHYGQTAWEIQKKLTPHEDVRDVMDLVRYINKKENLGDLKPGDKIIFLKEKEKEK